MVSEKLLKKGFQLEMYIYFIILPAAEYSVFFEFLMTGKKFDEKIYRKSRPLY